MSTKELIEEANKLLESNWEEHEKQLVKKLIDSLISYKALIPKSLKNDVKAMLQMANRIKSEYDDLLDKFKKEIKSEEHTEQLETDLQKFKELEEKIEEDIRE